ncbi:MAG: sensor histidine kinase [Lachnospiraceae bacterium]|nr:sensor histidine kinase [Lachnospiraceae bacterium]
MKIKRQNIIVQQLQDYRFNSILVRSFVTILAVLLCTFLGIMLLVSKKMDSLIEKEVSTISNNSLRQTAEHMDTLMNEVMQISTQLSLDDDIMNFLLTDTSDSGINHKETLLAKNKLKQYSDIFEYIDSIYVYSSKSNYIVTEEGGGNVGSFDDLTWYENITERIYEPARMISRLKYNKYPYLITYILPVRLTQMQFLGGILVNVDVEKAGEFAPTEEDETLLIIDERNNIIFSSNDEYRMGKWNQLEFYDAYAGHKGNALTLDINGRSTVLLQIDSDNFGWSYASLVPLEKYRDYQRDLRDFMVTIVALIIILTMVLSVLIAIYSYEPVKNIISLVKNPASYSQVEASGFRKDEAQEIIQNIVHNFYSNSQLQQDLKDYLDITNKAQLIALQAQISPHFLYNTLENIRWRAIDICKGDNEVSQIILNLSQLLRISLDNERPIITLEEEVENTRLYIEILQLRYENKLLIEWQIEQELLACQIVKVSLQPLIENAVYHGIKPMRGKGFILIRAYRSGDQVILAVQDNGVGMSREECDILNRDMEEKYEQKEDHIGVRNVNQRLKLLLGDEAGIHIESEKGKGTVVLMTVPYRVME